MTSLLAYPYSYTYSIPEFLHAITQSGTSAPLFKGGDALRIVANDKSAVTLPLFVTYSHDFIPGSKKHKIFLSLAIDTKSFSSVVQEGLKECIELAYCTAHVFCNKIHRITHYHNISYEGLRQREMSLVLKSHLCPDVLNLIVEFLPETWDQLPTFDACEFGVEGQLNPYKTAETAGFKVTEHRPHTVIKA